MLDRRGHGRSATVSEIAGGTPGVHSIEGYVEVQGLTFPTVRRIYPHRPDGASLSGPLMVSIDLSDIRLR